MSLCIGFRLSVKSALALIQSAGRTLTWWNREDLAYRYILEHLRGWYIEDVNVFLDELGMSPLGSKTNQHAL